MVKEHESDVSTDCTPGSRGLIEEFFKEATLQTHYFNLIKSGKKTVEGRCASQKFKNFCKGDIIRFKDSEDPGNHLYCVIMGVSKYDTFYEMLTHEGVTSCLPGTDNMEDAVNIYLNIPGYSEKEKLYGVLAFRIQITSTVTMLSDDNSSVLS